MWQLATMPKFHKLSDAAEALLISNKICVRAPDFHQGMGSFSHG